MNIRRTFGSVIVNSRKEQSMSQKDLAARIKREDGESISPQYLNDIERDRRNPTSDHLIHQFAKVLSIEEDYLYYLAGRFPEDLRNKQLAKDDVASAMNWLRKLVNP